MVNKLTDLINRCITELREVSIMDTKKLVSIASDILSIVYYSANLNGFRRDHIKEDVEEQTERKYAELISK